MVIRREKRNAPFRFVKMNRGRMENGGDELWRKEDGNGEVAGMQEKED